MKKIIALLLVLTMVFALAACAKSPAQTTPADETPADTTGDTAQSDAQTPADETPAAPATSDDPNAWIIGDTSLSGTVRFWIPFKGDQGMDDLIADFNKVYPNITVELTTFNNNADGNLSVNTAIMNGEVDVLGSFGLQYAQLRWANGLYEDLTDRIQAENIDLVANWGTDAYNYEGRYYTIPAGGLSYYICINMDAWKAAGYDELPTEWTWDEYLEACQKMTTTNADGEIVYGGSDTHSIETFTLAKYQVTGQDQFYDESTGLSSFGMDVVRNALAREVKAELEDKIWFPCATYRSNDLQGQNTFPAGLCNSIITQNMARFLRDTENYGMDSLVGFAPYPVEEKGQTNYMSGVGVFSHYGIATGCQDEDAAWAFLKWMTTYGSKYLAVAGHQSCWTGTDSAELVSLIFGSEEEAAKIIDVESFKRCVGNSSNPGYIDTITTANSDVVKILKSYALSALNGEISVEEAMTAAQAEADAAIKDAQ